MPTKQKSGLYRSKVKIGTAPDGSPIYKYISGRTVKELNAARQRVIAYYITGDSQPDDQLFGPYCIRWYHARVEPSASPATRSAYQKIMNHHVLPVFGNRNLRAVKSIDIQEFINTYSGKSKSTVTQIMTVLHGVFHSAIVDRIITQDPTAYIIKPPAAKQLQRRALTSEETAALLPLMDSTQPGLFLAVLYYLGLRTGEACGLQWGDFDFDSNFVHIQRDIDSYAHSNAGPLKTSSSDRFVPVPRQLAALLLPVRADPSAFVLHKSNGQPLTTTVIYRLWMYLMIRAGLAVPNPAATNHRDIIKRYTCEITPYYLRHNYITMCFNANLNPLIVQRLVGHSSYSTTANVYTHVSRDNLAAALSLFD